MAFNLLSLEVSTLLPLRRVTSFSKCLLLMYRPFQLNEQIAMFLDTDRQVCDFRLICHATNAAVDTYRCGESSFPSHFFPIGTAFEL